VVGEREAAKTAVEAMKILQEWDELKERKGRKRIYPTLLKEWLQSRRK